MDGKLSQGERIALFASPVLVALVLIAFAWYALTPPEEVVERSYSTAVYTEQGGAKFVVASGGEIEVQSGGTVDFQSGATVGLDAVTVAGTITQSDGDLIVADDIRVTAQTEISVTNGAAFAPTGTYQPIAAASEVTPTVTVGTAGNIVVLVNTETNVINLADSGTAKLTAAVALGQYDSITLLSDGTNWIEISRADN